MATLAGSVLRRLIEINGHEFAVFGKAPWIVMPVAKTAKTPECFIIIEGSLVTYLYGGNTTYSPHRFNALAKMGQLGSYMPVAFTGETGKARADDICFKLNDKLDK
jgi:hypothetical protein